MNTEADLRHPFPDDAAAGDEQQNFDALYRRYYPRLIRFCSRRLRDRSVAEDLAQETLVRALIKMDDFEPGRPVWPWLKAVALNLIIDHVRHAGWEEPALQPGDDVAQDPLEASDDRLVLSEALSYVPCRQREALALRYLGDFEPDEAAAYMDMRMQPFNQLVYRARMSLKLSYSNLVETALGLVAFPIRWLERRYWRLSARASGWDGRGAEVLSSGAATQLVGGLLAVAVVLGGAPGVEEARPEPPPESLEITSLDADPAHATMITTSARRPLQASASAAGPSSNAPTGEVAEKEARVPAVKSFVDPNRNVDEPEDARVEGFAASDSSDDPTIFAAGTAACGAPDCPPVLFRTSDGGTTWTRLAAEGLSGTQILLPPAYGVGDDRIFAMGPDGLQVSNDRGRSFDAAAPAGGKTVAGSAAVSPLFNEEEPLILIGAQTLFNYDDRRKALTTRQTGRPMVGPLKPVFSPTYRADYMLMVGGAELDPATKAISSTVYTCKVNVCSAAYLPESQLVPQVRPSVDFAVTKVAYAFTQEAIFVTHDGGSTFNRLPSPLKDRSLTELLVTREDLLIGLDPTEQRDGSVYHSANGGATWTELDSPLFDRGVGPILLERDRLLVGLQSGGIACSINGGRTWGTRC